MGEEEGMRRKIDRTSVVQGIKRIIMSFDGIFDPTRDQDAVWMAGKIYEHLHRTNRILTPSKPKGE